jgi:hypothetical protein
LEKVIWHAAGKVWLGMPEPIGAATWAACIDFSEKSIGTMVKCFEKGGSNLI